ncbi:MAG: DUF4347 domain-containing protein [Cyanobacteria bacterium RM1_2_2]|nr:DUF4347 domain-containing protein [Cyanobacteria bacterium RM1_2_2]
METNPLLNSQHQPLQANGLEPQPLLQGLSSGKPDGLAAPMLVPPIPDSESLRLGSETGLASRWSSSPDATEALLAKDWTRDWLPSGEAPWVGQAQDDILTNPGSLARKPFREIVFIDPGVGDHQQIVDDIVEGINPTAEVVILDGSKDGITQISEFLSQQQDVRAIHVISHGNEAALNLGSVRLDRSNLGQYAEQLQSWQEALTADADILLYGCNLASGVDGKAFVTQLSQLTGADVAASDDLTGASNLGGDWELEYATGLIEQSVFQVASYHSVLETEISLQSLYDAWQNNSLPDLNSVKLTLDNGTLFRGTLTAENQGGQLKLTATNARAFVGSRGSADPDDDAGLDFTGVNLEFLLNSDKTYAYRLTGNALLTGATGLALAGTMTAEANNTGSSVSFSQGQVVEAGASAAKGNDLLLNINNYLKLTGDVSVSSTSSQLSLGVTDLNTFFGLDQGTPQTTDDVGLHLNSATAALVLNTADDTFEYTVSGNAAFTNVSAFGFSAEDALIAGNQSGNNVTLGRFSLEAGNLARLSGDALEYSLVDTPDGKVVRLSALNAGAQIGQGADTPEPDDDAGLEISDASFSVTFKDNQTYSYTVTQGSVLMVGVAGLDVAAENVTATGDQDNIDLTLTNAELTLGTVANLSGSTIQLSAKDTAGGKTIRFSGTNLSAFVGAGADTSTTIDDVGLEITNVTLNELLLNADQTFNYSLSAASAGLRGLADVTLSAQTVSATGNGDATSLTLGRFDLGAGNFASLSGDGLRVEASDSELLLAGLGVSAFVGVGEDSDAVGLSLSSASFGMLLRPDAEGEGENTYALQATGAIGLVGIPDLTLQGNLTLNLNRTGEAVDELITFANGQTGKITFDDTQGDIAHLSGSARLDMAGFAVANGDFLIEKVVVADSGNELTRFLIGATNVTAFVGSGYGTASAVGVQISDGELGLVIERQDSDPVTYAMVASGDASLLGMAGLTARGSLALEVNRMEGAVDQTLSTPGGDVTVTFSDQEGNITRAVGQLELGIDGFAEISGEFGIEKTADKLKLGARDATAFVGANGTGLQISDADLGMVVYTDRTGNIYALTASGEVSLTGVPDVTLTGDLTLAVNRTGEIVDETIAMPGDDISVKFASDADVTNVTGDVMMNVAGFIALDGSVAVEHSTTTSGNTAKTDLCIGISDANAFVGAGYGTAGATGVELEDSQFGLVLKQETDSLTGQVTRQGYAFQGKGKAGLVGVDGLTLSGDLEVDINRMGEAVEVEIDTPDGTVEVKFDNGLETTSVTGTVDLDVNGVVQASGKFGLQKEVETGNGVTETKLLIGIADAETFVGAGAVPQQNREFDSETVNLVW